MPSKRPTLLHYALRLHSCEGDGSVGPSGQLESVTSGRRHDFDSAEGLLACLRLEQKEAALHLRPAAAQPAPTPPQVRT